MPPFDNGRVRCPYCQSHDVHHLDTIEHLRLAVWRCPGCAAQFTTETDRPNTTHARAARRLILNVDDRPPALYTRNRMLRAHGFAVADAQTGGEAWDAAITLKPNVILLDVHLPDADGRRLCRRMRDHRVLGAIPVVLISATLHAQDGLDLARWGAASFLREPVEPHILAATLRRAVETA